MVNTHSAAAQISDTAESTNVAPIAKKQPQKQEQKSSVVESSKDQQQQARPVVIRPNNKSRAIVTRKIEVGSNICQSIFRRNIDFISTKLFNLSVIIPVLSANDSQTEVVENELEKMFDTCEDEIRNGTERLKHYMQQNDIREDEVCKYDKPLVREVTLDNPHTARYINCIKALDELLRLTSHVWICGLMTNVSKKKVDSDWRSKVMKLQQQIAGLENRCRGAVRKKGVIDEVLKLGVDIEDRADEQEQMENLNELEPV